MELETEGAWCGVGKTMGVRELFVAGWVGGLSMRHEA